MKVIWVSDKVWWWFILLLFFCTLPVSGVFAETKVFEKEAEKVVGKRQGLDQTKTFAQQKKKGLHTKSYDKATVYQVQKGLKELGYAPGTVDGILGKQTEGAIKKFQHDKSLSVTGRVDSIRRNQPGPIYEKSGVPKKDMTAKPFFDFLLYGILLTTALYHFCFFMLRRKDNSSLYFGCLCILIAFLYMKSAEKSFTLLFADFHWEVAGHIEFISIYLGFTIFVMFVSSLYPAEFSQIMLRVCQSLGALFTILTLTTKVEIYAYEIMAYGVVALVFSVYSIYVLIRAILNKRDGAILFFAGFLFLFILIINDIFYDQSILSTSELVPLGVFIVIFSQSFVLSLRFSRSSEREVVYERFVPKEFLKNLDKEDIADVKLGDNAEKAMSILFSDIRDFTTLSEQMTPEQNFKFINSYLNVMGPVIRRNKGFIDKYIGDAIMALFDKNADDAVRGAIEMLRKLGEYNEGRKQAGYAPIRIGIGINTGILRIGTIGESGRMEGTVISDAVNVASRIEGMTKVYGVSLLISDETFRSLEDPSKYHTRKIDQIKGKTEPVRIWEVFDKTIRGSPRIVPGLSYQKSTR